MCWRTFLKIGSYHVHMLYRYSVGMYLYTSNTSYGLKNFVGCIFGMVFVIIVNILSWLQRFNRTIQTSITFPTILGSDLSFSQVSAGIRSTKRNSTCSYSYLKIEAVPQNCCTVIRVFVYYVEDAIWMCKGQTRRFAICWLKSVTLRPFRSTARNRATLKNTLWFADYVSSAASFTHRTF